MGVELVVNVNGEKLYKNEKGLYASWIPGYPWTPRRTWIKSALIWTSKRDDDAYAQAILDYFGQDVVTMVMLEDL